MSDRSLPKSNDWMLVNEHTINGCYAPDIEACDEAASSSPSAQTPSEGQEVSETTSNSCETNDDENSNHPATRKDQDKLRNSSGPADCSTESPSSTSGDGMTANETSPRKPTTDNTSDQDLGDPPRNYVADSRHHPPAPRATDDAHDQEPDPRIPRRMPTLTPELLSSLGLTSPIEKWRSER